jgi:hypothetical protein
MMAAILRSAKGGLSYRPATAGAMLIHGNHPLSPAEEEH